MGTNNNQDIHRKSKLGISGREYSIEKQLKHVERTVGTEGRNDVILKKTHKNCHRLYNGAHLHAQSSMQELELPQRATPARAGIREERACWRECTTIWSLLL